MATTAPPKPLTAEQLASLPDDGMRHEIVEGVLRTMSPAGGTHGRTGATLLAYVTVHVRSHSLGAVFTAETGFRLARDPDTVRAPDLAFVGIDRADEADVPGFPELAPDLIAEVVSPHDRAVDVSAKALAWLDAGVRLVWVVDPVNRTVTVYTAGTTAVVRGDGRLDGGAVLPGFELALAQLWD